MSTLSERVTMKYPPFEVSYIGEKHPLIAHLFAQVTSQLTELPDFSRDKKIAVLSDFGGEHKGASFFTYSFLLISYDKISPFIEAVAKLRSAYDILDPYSEFAYKDLNYGPRKRALPGFLKIVDTLLHGALITVAVDKKIVSLFGADKKSVHTQIQKEFADAGLADWKFESAEKALRICHSISFFASLTTHNDQRLLWYCDSDTVNDNEVFFNDTRNILNRTLGLYVNHSFDILGFAKSFEGKSHLDDLLSITDLAAGVIQDLLSGHNTENDQINENKVPLIKWLTQRSNYLTKITLQMLRLPNGDISSGIVEFNKPPANSSL
ncbi:hypothetical protein [Pseudomonas sp. Irchel 3A7]|uniref:hypothetical protein n=1 Tax=Pseudomonas sp. Irchel 3A7 TaxID=2008913 RepID=UPI000BA450B4|nr:hypothetical protein [Pseudomonas sp. Irchel 3A7]